MRGVMLMLTGPAERIRGHVFSQIRDFILLESREGLFLFLALNSLKISGTWGGYIDCGIDLHIR